MARITVEDCLDIENNRFALVLLASQRAKQLLNGAPLLIPETKNKSIVNSLREIADGQVRFMSEEDLAKKREAERLEEEALLAREREQAATNGHEVNGDALFRSDDDSDDSESDNTASESSDKDESGASDNSEEE